MAADKKSIVLTNITKKFGSKKALNDVSFTVPRGSICGFLGPNGAGKTTTIRCLMNFIRPTLGTIEIFGLDAQKHSTELKNQIGFLSADTQLNMGWTGNDHIKLIQSMRGVSKNTSELVKLLDLDTNIRVKSLSSGNQQKLAIILACIGQPKLLVMDEPTRGLDPMLQNILYELLQDFTARGGTVFFSSHNLPEVQRVCDTVIIIKEGRIITEKTMDDIRGLKTHIITASSSKNFDLVSLQTAGVDISSIHPKTVSLAVHGDLNEALKKLVAYPLTDLDVTHASLEDIFMEQYK